MRREISTLSTNQSNSIRHMARYTIGLVTALVGLADMLSSIVPKLDWSILLGAWPIATTQRGPAQIFTVVIGFFLIMLSYGLAKGKNHAWRISLMLLLLSALLHVQRNGSVLATVVALLLALLLCMLVQYFQAKSDPPSVRKGYIVLCLGLGIVTFYAIGGFIALYDSFAPWVERIGVEGFLIHVLSYGPVHVSRGTPAFFFQRAVPVLCSSAVIYGMVKIFRPVAAVLLPDKEACGKVHELVRLYGGNSIAYFALSEEKTYFFARSGRAVISYVLEGSTAVVAGDPIGPESELAPVVQQFIDFCREQDWTIVFWQVRDEVAALYKAAGFSLLKIGEDAVINPQTFTLKGGSMANVRSSAKRAEKDGVCIQLYRGQVTDDEQLVQMENISRAWLSDKDGCEMGFSMGQFSTQCDREQLYALAVDAANKVHAFVSFIPIYGRNGWGLDLMRRAEQTAPGVMELLLARTMDYMKNNGAQMVSLGLAPLSNANGEDGTFIETSIDFLQGHFGNPAKNRSLFNFKKKFQPTWESRYLVYSGALSLPKIGIALYHAHQTDMTLLRAVSHSLNDWGQQIQHRRKQAALQFETAQV